MGYGMQSSAPPLSPAPKGYSNYQQQQFTPEQLKLFQGLFSHAGPGSFLGKLAGGDQSQFEQVEAPAMRQFGELQGGLASRFSGMGMGARKSSGFGNTMNQATSDFAQQLQSQRMGLQQNALEQLMGMSNMLMGQRPYEQSLVQKPKSGFGSFLGALAPAAGQMAGAYIGAKYGPKPAAGALAPAAGQMAGAYIGAKYGPKPAVPGVK